MAKPVQKQPIALHPEQQSTPKQPWERMEGEPPRWFLRFRSYLLIGRGRSLQAIVEQERQGKKAPRGTADNPAPKIEDITTTGDGVHVSISVPGAWKRASITWRWVERAEAFDCHERDERNRKLLAFLDHEAEYISKAQRLNALDLVMHGLMTNVLENPTTGESYQNYLGITRTILATLREIRREMNSET